jgi:hypothetical protein
MMAEEMPAAPTAPTPEPMMEMEVQEPQTNMSRVLGLDMNMANAMESGSYKTCGCSDGSRVILMN